MATLYELISDLNRPFGEAQLWTISDKSFKKVARGLERTIRKSLGKEVV